MKRVIKAIPWVLLARLGLKGLSLLFVAIVAIVVFAGKVIAELMSEQSQKDEESDCWAAYQPGARQLRPDLPPYGSDED